MAATLAPDVQTALDALKSAMSEIYGSRLAGLILYGSRARGDARPDSDVDVAVILTGLVKPCEEIERTSFLRQRLCLETGLVVSCVYLPCGAVETEGSPLAMNIRREGVPL